MPEIKCPLCGSPMVRRIARKGANAGQPFWGCSKFGSNKCTGTIAIQDSVSPKEAPLESARSVPRSEPVEWHEHFLRREYDPRYFTLGAKPGFLSPFDFGKEDIVRHGLIQALMLSKQLNTNEATRHAKLIGGVIQKLLTRGDLPLCTMSVEEELAKDVRLADKLLQLEDTHDEIGWVWNGRTPASFANDIASAWSRRRVPAHDTIKFFVDGGFEGMFDSRLERDFLCKWLPREAAANMIHWFTPQASLDKLLQGKGLEGQGARRVDFLFYHPMGQPLAVELDGDEHQNMKVSDGERKKLLQKAGIKTIRLSNNEILRGSGRNLELVKDHIKSAFEQYESDADFSGIGDALVSATEAARLQYALAHALERGHLKMSQSIWNINIASQRCTADVIEAATRDFNQMLDGLNVLFGGKAATPRIVISHGETSHDEHDLTIGLYPFESALTVENVSQGEQILLCSAAIPVALETRITGTNARSYVNNLELREVEQHLTVFLQTLFRKRKFRAFQCEALLNVLQGKDTVTLLPTGAGKSIIYQIAGLLLPGVTLIIDPIIALIHDQIEGLERVGIDKAIGITSTMDQQTQKLEMMRIEKGVAYFVFVAPERMQMPEFRNALRALRGLRVINMAVIDEAHCVSEWGHNFRPPYLKLASSLRGICQSPDGSSPTLLALTGTASRAVLRELVAELDIDDADASAIVRPLTFDRQELKFHISRIRRNEDRLATIKWILNSLPEEFGLQPAVFYKPSGSLTRSGIVFTLHVNGRFGHEAVKSDIEKLIKVPVTTYSGKVPKGVQASRWDMIKQKNASDFKANVASVIVATNAFGMGIDKPNIRWSLHTGIPLSMEAFYQEAGRVGRDKSDAHCHLIFHEASSKLTDEAFSVAASLDIEQLRAYHKKKMEPNRDDVSNTLYFHLNAFSGKAIESKAIDTILAKVDNFEQPGHFELPFGDERDSLELAILRMIKTGLLDDYEVKYGSRFFVLHASEYDFARSRKVVESYIAKSQPGRLKQLLTDLDAIAAEPRSSQPRSLCKFMTDFTYEMIEQSRRRKLYEMILLCRNCSDDDEIRQYLINYLQEGFSGEKLRKLAEQDEVVLADWLELFSDVPDVLDAGAMRGDAIRLLEAYPAHPGLLVARSVSEALATAADEIAIRNDLYEAFTNARKDYSVSALKIDELCIALIDIATGRAQQLRIPLTNALHKYHVNSNELDQCVFNHLTFSAEQWDIASKLYVLAAASEHKLESALATLEGGINRYRAIMSVAHGGSDVEER